MPVVLQIQGNALLTANPPPPPAPPPPPPPPPAPPNSVGLMVQGAPTLPYTGTTTPVTVSFLSGTPTLIQMNRDGNPTFASWPTGAGGGGSDTFFTQLDSTTLTGNWCISQSCWGNTPGAHTLNVIATYADQTQATATVNVIAQDASPSVTTAYVLTIETVATDARAGDRGVGWGGGGPQSRHTVMNDGTEYIIYPRGTLDTSGRNWALRKRDPATATWSQVATGQTNADCHVFRTPDDKVHVAALPNFVWNIHTGPSFTASVVPGSWTNEYSAYTYAGLFGYHLILKNFHDTNSPDATYNTNVLYQHALWSGSAWSFDSVLSGPNGLRFAYDVVLPEGFSANEMIGVQLGDVKKGALGITTTSGTYIWDSVKYYRTGYTSAASFAFTSVSPFLTQQGDTSANFVMIMDAWKAGDGKLYIMWYSSRQGRTLKVYDSSNTQLFSGAISDNTGIYKFYEDGAGRLWAITGATGASNAIVRIYRVNADYSMTLHADLSSSFAGYQMNTGEGYIRIACERTGSVIGTVLSGHFPSGTGSTVVAFRIRMPD